MGGWRLALAACAAASVVAGRPMPGNAEAPLRAGIIGCDTSHAVAFTELINAKDATGPRARVEVVAAYPGGSDDIPSSRDRVAGYVAKLEEMGIEIVQSIDELVSKVDVVLLESVDGRPHLEQVRPVLASKKPVFIDKPLAGSLADAVEIARLAESAGVPWFSCSALRFSGPAIKAREAKIGQLLGCHVYAPCALEPHHPDLFWYGVHGVETLYALMGPGCRSVSRVHTADVDVVVGVWSDGRVGVFRGLRKGKVDYGATVFGVNGIATVAGFDGYAPLVDEICTFFVSGKAPVATGETLEMFAFMEAADVSKQRGGTAVALKALMDNLAQGR